MIGILPSSNKIFQMYDRITVDCLRANSTAVTFNRQCSQQFSGSWVWLGKPGSDEKFRDKTLNSLTIDESFVP